MRLAYRLVGIAVIVVAAFFFVGGIATLWSDADMDTWGKVMVGSAFAALGVVIAMGGWQLVRRSRA
jgi:hypothetical protein